ncbi:extracellular solute-binding protein [Fusobacterium sp.]|uniref:extracellular solute-binding protein n=1 Tax=Fusobacterium sp. TaxID=68766 RepID=UPI0026029F03|nr:extracellular solute-binding protein [Fusobacterium sp.]
MKKIFLGAMLALTLIGCGAKDDSIILYTNSGSNGRSEFLKEYAKENGFNLDIVSAGGTDITNRLLAEKNNPIADVIFGLNNMEYEKLKRENILKKFSPSWADQIPEGLSDAEGYYNAVTVTPLLAVYNTDIINGENIPKDWTDLATNPKFTGKYFMFGTNGGTGKAVMASVVSRYRDDNGELKISKDGWEMTKKLYTNGYVERGEEDWFGNLMSGKRPILMLWGSGALERQKANNIKLGVMKPEIGVPFVVEQIALVNKKGDNEQVEKFADWLGSPEVQIKWAEKFGTAPAHPAALEKAPAEVKELVESVKIQNLDWKFISENIDSWIEKIELEFIK